MKNEIESLVQSEDWNKLAGLLDERGADGIAISDALFLLSVAKYKTGDYAQALDFAKQAFDADSNVSNYANFLSALSCEVGMVRESYFYAKMRSAGEGSDWLNKVFPDGSLPDYTDALASAVDQPLLRKAVEADAARNWDEALHWYAQHVSIFPLDLQAHLALVGCLMQQERYLAALSSLRAALTILPGEAELSSQLGMVLHRLGRFDESKASHRWALAEQPDNVLFASRYCQDIINTPTVSDEGRKRISQGWGNQFGLDVQVPFPIPERIKDKKTLSVGVLLAGVDVDRVGHALARVLSNHDPNKLFLSAYGDGNLSDAKNTHFQKCFSDWRNVSDVEPATFANMIAADGMDVILDVSGFGSKGLSGVLNSRLAPLQISWLGAPCGMGLKNIDAVISDEIVTDADHRVSLESGSLIAQRRGNVRAPNLEKNAVPTFVADVDLASLTPETVFLWAQVLSEEPEAQLLLRDRDFFSEENGQRLIGLFGNFGLSHRVDIIAESDRRHLFLYGDVVLLPKGGATPDVVLDALDAGKPIIALEKGNMPTHNGWRVLDALGMKKDHVASSDAAYVQQALSWARNRAQCEEYEKTIEDRLLKTSFFDADAKMKELQAVIEQLWRFSDT